MKAGSPLRTLMQSAAYVGSSTWRADSGHSPQPRVNVAEMIKAAIQSVCFPGLCSAPPQGGFGPRAVAAPSCNIGHHRLEACIGCAGEPAAPL